MDMSRMMFSRVCTAYYSIYKFIAKLAMWGSLRLAPRLQMGAWLMSSGVGGGGGGGGGQLEPWLRCRSILCRLKHCITFVV